MDLIKILTTQNAQKITQAEILSNEVRALSWKQPFCSLMLEGKQETRSWATGYRGLVLGCASVVPYADTELKELSGNAQYMRILQVLGPKWYNSVKRGNALWIGRLIDCIPMSAERVPFVAEAWTFVKYNADLFVHIYTDVTPIEPFVWRGSLGWKTLTEDQKQLIKPL